MSDPSSVVGRVGSPTVSAGVSAVVATASGVGGGFLIAAGAGMPAAAAIAFSLASGEA